MVRKTIDIDRVAVLVALASILQVLESFFPHPVPGVRLGLANMITLVALVREGAREAIGIAVLRTIISSFMLGTFMSPSFVLSFVSALASALLMAGAYTLFAKSEKRIFSLVGISLIGAFAHAATQLVLVYLLFVRHTGVFMITPVIGVSAVVTGWVNGLVASGVCNRLSAGVTDTDADTRPAQKAGKQSLGELPGFKTPDARERGAISVPAEISIVFVAMLGISVILFDNLIFYSAIAVVLVIAALALRIRAVSLLRPIWNMRFFIAFSFLVPALFSGGGKIFFRFAFVIVSGEGIGYGASFASRIIVLMLASTLLVLATTPERLALGIRKLLSPFSFTGLPSAAIGQAITKAWMLLPLLWKDSVDFLGNGLFKRQALRKRKIIDNISNFVAALYVRYGNSKNGKKSDYEIT